MRNIHKALFAAARQSMMVVLRKGTWATKLQTKQATFLVEHHFLVERMTDTQTYLLTCNGLIFVI